MAVGRVSVTLGDRARGCRYSGHRVLMVAMVTVGAVRNCDVWTGMRLLSQLCYQGGRTQVCDGIQRHVRTPVFSASLRGRHVLFDAWSDAGYHEDIVYAIDRAVSRIDNQKSASRRLESFGRTPRSRSELWARLSNRRTAASEWPHEQRQIISKMDSLTEVSSVGQASMIAVRSESIRTDVELVKSSGVKTTAPESAPPRGSTFEFP